jgi:hypothetical protein
LGQAVLALAGLDVLLAAEAIAGIQVKAIAQDRMKVVRRMGDPALVQFNRDIDPPPLKWSDLRYVFDIQEDCNGKEAIQA